MPKNPIGFLRNAIIAKTVVHHKEETLRRALTIIILLIFSFKSYSQERIIVDTDIIGLSSLTGNKQYSFYLTDLKNVPKNIQFNLDNYLKIILDKLYPNAAFRDGYISDLAGYFEENPNAFDRGWIITKYQFVFNLQKPDIGIINYPIKVDMDEYGQIINCNWPRKWFGNVNDFVERTKIERKAIEWAKKNYLNSADFDVDLKYDSKNNTMNWVFKFPSKKPSVSRSYQVLEIDWDNNKIVKEYNIYIKINH